MDAAWVTALGTLAALAGGTLLWIGRHTWRFLRRVVHFLDDYAGQPARDGMPAKPGFMARLGSVEELTAKVSAEMHPNGGQSLRDVVNRTAADVADIKTDQARMTADQADLRTRVEDIQRKGHQ